MARPRFDSRYKDAPLVRVGLCLAVVLATAGCDPFGDNPSCDADCTEPFVCDENRGECRPRTTDFYDIDRPGRSLETARVDDGVVFSSIHPERGLVTAGSTRSDAPTYVLDELGGSRPFATSIAGDESSNLAAVAWLDETDGYRLSVRRGGEWRPSSEVEAPDQSYTGSEHFDLAVDSEGALFLVFRSAERRSLRMLSREEDGDRETWQLETIDDGSAVASRSDCSATSSLPDAPGVGLDPDVEISPAKSSELFVSYYDSNCGDLRLAHFSEGEWSVRVVDTGNYSVENDPTRRSGDVGRFSALAVHPNNSFAVAYQDVERGQLMFASESNGNIGTTQVDPGLQLDEFSQERKQLVGAFADLTFDEGGRPYIAYLNGSEMRLQFAYRARDNQGRYRWFHSPLGPPPPAGTYANIEIRDDRIRLYSEKLDRTDNGYESTLTTVSRELP